MTKKKTGPDCQSKLIDGVSPCPYKSLPGERLCGLHKKREERLQKEKALHNDGESERNKDEKEHKQEKIEMNQEPTDKSEEEEDEDEDENIVNPNEPEMSEYRREQLEIISKIDKNDPKNAKLFVVKFPEGARLIDFDTNKENGIELDFSKITYGSTKKTNWFCPNYLPGHGTFTCFSSKTSGKRVNKKGKKILQGCKQCCFKRVHDVDEVNKLVFAEKDENKESNTEIGDETETYVANLLSNSKKYKNIEKIGNQGCSADIKITYMDDSVNYIQVKTLMKRSATSFSIDNRKKYVDNMLMACVDKTRQFFALDFYKNLKGVDWINFEFDDDTSEYWDIMYNDEIIFLDELHELLPLSTKENAYSKSAIKEKEMLERLEKYCKENGLIYQRNTTNGNTIDGYINGYSFQAKFKTKNYAGNTYQINFVKNCGRLNKKGIRKSYEYGDFDFFIVEVGGLKQDKSKNYKGNFCIIPKDEFLAKESYHTKNKKGHNSFYVCAPDAKDDHWSNKFWNIIPDELKQTKNS